MAKEEAIEVEAAVIELLPNAMFRITSYNVCYTKLLRVSDLLTRIRNAHLAKHDRVDVPTSKLKAEICRILMEEGFIRNFRQTDGKPVGRLRIFLEYGEDGSPAITHLQRVSKPGRRVYRGAGQIPPVLGSYNFV